ncbi:MAG: undecaprenyl-diphosphate phosphatase [Deltaproteobacteria bacterium]|nr:undecaprenyl-diphosphate phosphatase [Deltaproteobacteria bacterium]
MEGVGQAIILGIVEGLTEFLPVSSTGHMILTAELLGMEHSNFLKTFEISIQLGAILAVVILYWHILTKNVAMLKKIIIAFIPTGVLGFAFYGIVKEYLLGSSTVVLWALLGGGIALIVLEILLKKKEPSTMSLEEISYKQSLLIGLAQSLAMIPGVSRSAATIMGGLFLRIDREAVVVFSFLLAIPTMGAATAYDLFKGGFQITPQEFWFLAVGFVVSFIVAIAAIKFFLRFIRTHTFIPFGVYRIALFVVWVYFLGI